MTDILHWREVSTSVLGARSFQGKSPKTNGLVVIIDTLTIDGKKWRHLSASRQARTPSHEDMMLAADAFLDRDITSMAIYPPKAQWVNLMEFCLHIWQPIGFDPVPDPKLERARAVGLLSPAEKAEFEAYRRSLRGAK
jgi:hypothetical protein